jgi:hypothetical protein
VSADEPMPAGQPDRCALAGQPDRSLGAELRAPTRYTDGSTDETSEALDVIADLLAGVPRLP